MGLLRICASYPADMTVDHPAIRLIYFIAFEVYVISGYNRTFHREDNSEGCRERIITNESDLMPNLTPIKMSLPHFGKMIPTVLPSRQIVSSYKPTTSVSDTSIRGSLIDFFPYGILLVTLVTQTIHLIFRIHRKLHTTRKRRNDLIGITGISLGQYFLHPKADSLRLTTLSFIIFFFYMHFFFKAFMKTELVTLDHADVIETFEDVLSRPNLKAKWVSYESDYQYFRDADEGSVKKKIWEKSQPDPVKDINVDNGYDLNTELTSGQIVFIGTSYTMNLVYAGLCPYALFRKLNPVIIKSAHDEPESQASGYNDRLDESVVKTLHIRNMRSEQGGIVQYLMSIRMLPLNSFLVDLAGKKNVRLCLQNDVREVEKRVVDKKIEDYEILLTSYRYLVFGALIVLLLETFCPIPLTKIACRSGA